MLEDPDHVCAPGGKKRRQSTPCFNLILMKETSKIKSGRDQAFASRFQLQAGSTEEKQSWLEAFQQCGVSVLKTEKEVWLLHDYYRK